MYLLRSPAKSRAKKGLANCEAVLDLSTEAAGDKFKVLSDWLPDPGAQKKNRDGVSQCFGHVSVFWVTWTLKLAINKLEFTLP